MKSKYHKNMKTDCQKIIFLNFVLIFLVNFIMIDNI